MEYKEFSKRLAIKTGLFLSQYGSNIKLSLEDGDYFGVSPIARFKNWNECYQWLTGYLNGVNKGEIK